MLKGGSWVITTLEGKSAQQLSYGFQNSMSSWGVGVRFSKLPYSQDFFKIMLKVGCFKNTLLRWTFFQFDVKLGSRFLFVFNWIHPFFRMENEKEFRQSCVTKNLPPPSGVHQRFTQRAAKRRVWWDGLDGWDGSDGISKVSFNFLHTLWVKRLCIYILIYEIKVVTKILMGFKISCQVGSLGQKFQIYSR